MAVVNSKLSSSAATGTKIRKSTPADLPEQLTHYTDLVGLKGIIERKELWLSHAAFLNDPEELTHGIKLAKSVLTSLIRRSKASEPEAKGRKKLIADIASDFEGFKPPDAFITCLCEKNDLLSQWRGYSSRQGISITFNTRDLANLFANDGAEIQQVHYGMTETRNQLVQHIERELPDIVDDFEYLMGTQKDLDIRQSFVALMSTLVPRFKHFGFREEKEWRLVLMNPPKADVRFRPRSQLMLPYVVLTADIEQLPIERVTIGPGIQDAAVSRSIEFFLEAHDYDREIVWSSGTPYRS